mmetsp:Transcript_174077/g.558116  ORF Transcript_174077/g.558116 Transcript_174077/m.558116 type:complete len:113 (-) Transcript_174077:109-447(-)
MPAVNRGSSRRMNSASARGPSAEEVHAAAVAAARANVSWGAPGMLAEQEQKQSRATLKAASVIKDASGGERSCRPTDEDRAWELLLCMAGAQASRDTAAARVELRKLSAEVV